MSVRFYFRNADAPFDETATLLSGDLTPNIREVFCDRINHDDCKCSASTKNSITYADLGDHLPKSDKSVISVGSPRKITSSICFSSSFPVSTYMARYLLNSANRCRYDSTSSWRPLTMKYSFARTTIALALLAAAAYAGAATTQTWNLTTGDTTFRYENSITYENANRKKLTLTAYYADGINNVNQMVGDSVRTASLQSATRNAALKTTNSSGVWAGIGSFGGNGVGISNPVDTPATSGQENSNGGQHAIDNYDVYDTDVYNRSGSRIGRRNNVNMLSAQTHAHDFLLMDFKEVMELSTFRVSWKRFANTDIDFFLAPETLTGPLNLTGSTIQSLIDASWRQVSLTNVTACAISDSSASCPTQFSSAVSGYSDGMKGRYLIAAGMLGGNDDAFKFSQITMNVPSGGSGNVPIPGTAALIMIGLAGFTYSRGKPKGK